MIASLPMYDRPETAAANDRLWTTIRGKLGYGPIRLDRETPCLAVWHDINLLLSQTCGLPYRNKLHGKVQLVATPDYGLPDAAPGTYYSVFVAKQDDPGDLRAYQGKRFAFNSADSQSGWAAALTHANALGLKLVQQPPSGSHRNSALMVVDGKAELAAIDAQTWRMICRHDDFAAQLKVVDKTQPTPGLPLIASLSQDANALAQAVHHAIVRLPKEDQELLDLKGIVKIPAAQYLAIPTPIEF